MACDVSTRYDSGEVLEELEILSGRRDSHSLAQLNYNKSLLALKENFATADEHFLEYLAAASSGFSSSRSSLSSIDAAPQHVVDAPRGTGEPLIIQEQKAASEAAAKSRGKRKMYIIIAVVLTIAVLLAIIIPLTVTSKEPIVPDRRQAKRACSPWKQVDNNNCPLKDLKIIHITWITCYCSYVCKL